MIDARGCAPTDFVVVANRLPVDLERLPDGTQRWKASPGGLVSAMEPFLRSRRGAWVGWPGVPGAEMEPIAEQDMTLYPVMLSAAELTDYYEGFCNATLWPLYHDVVAPPAYHRHWWNAYVRVNQRFAAVTAKVAGRRATVWVQDYQLQLVPQMLRELRPDLRIGFFLHIPFPPVELFLQLPWRTELIRGPLGADLVGFHLPGGAQNFLFLARRLAGHPATRSAVGVRTRLGEVDLGDRTVRVGAFPISIDSGALDRLARRKPIRRRAAQIREELGNPSTIVLGADRLDYTKGIDVRLRAMRELYAQRRISVTDVVMVQLTIPSRERVEHYQRMREDIERTVSWINGEFGLVGHPAVHYLHRSIPRDELIAFYVAADVMLVTPVRDGMNLVAKEYVACQHEANGTLVLSEFAGAAAELTSAFLVNPHDLDGIKNAIESAITLEPEQARGRMRAMRRQVLTHDVQRWA
ncbi:MAG TPA: trehalose-6-phosphate synthase, partial [Pseudonocardiaceae bacterium]|nr:trehalose-6-phosphate synthase [Pseudonocardiaceae bacterium]